MNIDFSKLSDAQLCEHIDCPQAFFELEFRYLWLIRLKAKELLKGKAFDVDDFIQEGLLGLYHCAKSFKPSRNTSFKTYAGVCIQNRMLNELRRNLKHSKEETEIPLDEIDFASPSPEKEVELREDFKAVLNQIHLSLSDFEQKVLALYLSGYRRSEIPLLYGISLKAYDNALSRCKIKLRAHKSI